MDFLKTNIVELLALTGASGAILTAVAEGFPVGADPEHIVLFFAITIVPLAAREISAALKTKEE